jgi:hypothetical protein
VTDGGRNEPLTPALSPSDEERESSGHGMEGTFGGFGHVWRADSALPLTPALSPSDGERENRTGDLTGRTFVSTSKQPTLMGSNGSDTIRRGLQI